jgi:membrane fusion protein (multidrug efflux system)
MRTKPQVVEREGAGSSPEGGEALGGRKGRRDALVLVSLMVAVLAGIGGYALLTRGQETTDNAQLEADIVPLHARVSGQVLRVHVADNAHVRKGTVLVEVDPREYDVRVKEAEAELDSAKAQAQMADAQVTVAEAGARGGHSTARALVSSSTALLSSAEAQVSVARAALSRAEAEEHRAALEFVRARQLSDEQIASQAEFETMRAAHESAQAALAGARAQLVVAEQARQAALSRVAEAQGQLDQSAPVEAKIAAARGNAALAHARVKAAEAVLEQAQLMLEHTRILAPAEGQVSKLSVREGQQLSAGQPVAQLVPRQTYVIANFKETQVGRIRPGQRAEVTVDAFPGRKLVGQVESLSGGTGARFSLLPPDNASGNFVKVVQRVPIRITWVDPAEALPLQAGLSAEVTVFTDSPPVSAAPAPSASPSPVSAKGAP